MKKLVSPVGLGIVAAVLGMAVLVGFLTFRVFAISNTGPDASEYGGANAYYELSNTREVAGATSMSIPVYYPYNPGTVVVSVSCADGLGGVSVGATNICPGNKPFAVTFSLDTQGSGYYVGYINAQLHGPPGADTTYRAFRLRVPSPGLIGYSHQNSHLFAVGNINRCDASSAPGGADSSGCNKYFTYRLPLTGPCNASGTQSIHLYDADNSGTGDQYNIQPKKFTPTVYDITANQTIIPKLVSGGYGTNQDAVLQFNYTQYHRYQFVLSGIYSNNVLQFQLPFDSIFSLVSCPKGGANPQGAASGICAITGYVYNQAHPSDAMQYYIYVNPPPGAQTIYQPNSVPTAAQGFRGPAPADQPDPPGTPAGVPPNHGFVSPIHGPGGLDLYNYKGDSATNVFWVYGRADKTTNISRVAVVTVPPGTCTGTPSCNNTMTNFNSDKGVNRAVTFMVQAVVSGGSPPPGAAFDVTVTGPVGVAPAHFTPGTKSVSGNLVTSDDMTYPVSMNKPGTYTVSWTYDGVLPPCTASVVIGYNPYFVVQGGDVAAGVTFKNSGVCTPLAGPSADDAGIKSWNNDNSPANDYTGAGSQFAAFALGEIDSFVTSSDLDSGISNVGAPITPHALSFANTTIDDRGNYGGNFGDLPCVADYASTVAAGAPSAPSSDLGTYAASNSFNAPDGFQLSGTLNRGVHLVIKVNGNAYINGDIGYTETGPSDVPSLAVYATGGIYVNGNVREMHGTFVAQGGTFVTCATGPSPAQETTAGAGSTHCDNPLTVYGSVLAKDLHLDRSHGSLNTGQGPAENFFYSPEEWLSAASGPTCTTDCKYDAITSLPPVL